MNQPPTQPIQQMTPTPSKSGSLKWLLIVLVIIIVLGGGYLLWVKYGGSSTSTVTLTPTPTVSSKVAATPTTSASLPADWKTYTNSTYGISFKYPSDYSVIEGTDKKSIAVKDNASSPPVLTINFDSLVISDLNQTLEEVINQMQSSLSIRDTVSMTLDKQVAYEGISLGTTSEYTIVSKNEGHFYELNFETNNQDTLAKLKSGMSQIQNQILSTFQFTQ